MSTRRPHVPQAAADFLIHGVRLRLESECDEWLLPLLGRLACFAVPQTAHHTPDLRCQFVSGPPLDSFGSLACRGLRLVQECTHLDERDRDFAGIHRLNVLVDERAGDYYLDFGGSGWWRFNLVTGFAEACLNPSSGSGDGLGFNVLFFYVLDQLLSRRGRFLLHSAAVEWRGEGILLVGTSGSGKTTSCLALVRDGHGFLGDDTVLIMVREHQVDILAFPDEVDVTAGTAGLFPELGSLSVPHTGRRKASFRAVEMYPGCLRESIPASLLLFPQVAFGETSRVEPMTEFEALDTLLRQSLYVLDKGAARSRFEIFSTLVASTRAFRLCVGSDVAQLSKVVEVLF